MTIFERLKNIRNYRNLSQEEVGTWFNMSKQGWGKNEKGQAKGLGPAEILLFLKKTQMSSSYLFGETDSLEKADLTKNHKQEGIGDLIQTIRDQEKIIINLKMMIESKKVDELSLRISNTEELKNIIDIILYWSPDMLREVEIFVKGLTKGLEKGLQHQEKDTVTKSA